MTARQLDAGLVRPRYRNQRAIERTVAALREDRRLEEVDAGLVAAVRTLAVHLDEADKPYVAATVARVHLEGLRLLLGRPAPEQDELDAFIRSLGTATVGDTPAT